MLYNHIEQVSQIAEEKRMREENIMSCSIAHACMYSEKNIHKKTKHCKL